eukprot:TRINITY_DN1779_c0_g1_i5.p1 TRINITY_DN1779_c0_g1~~TRINITY_DN1779_c0_g1_i5.p1  ORF type:complete len:249 (+),score=53.49 TRINITY_DN1779_c0_g1_i5:742-1488(+)
MWSLGIVLYTLLVGAFPFDEPNLHKKICEGRYYLPLYLSAAAKDLIVRLIQRDPRNRTTIPEIKNHPWYSLDLPFYIQIMDNSKSEMQEGIDKEVFKAVCDIKEYDISSKNDEEVKRHILERRTDPYCIAYELLKASKDKKQSMDLMSGKVQMIFSNENIRKLREKKEIAAQSAITDSMSELATAPSISEVAGADAEMSKSANNWVFGIQGKAYPYNLLMAIGECLQEMGFVFALWCSRSGSSSRPAF